VLAESVGGLIGGIAGGMLPDFIDLPTSPNHRSLAHGALPAIGIGFLAFQRLDRWQDALRTQAQHYEQLRLASPSPWAQLGYGLLWFFWMLLPGVLAGFLVGYASHLVLDLPSTRSLPAVC
jgi:hypothetical protein